MAQIQSVDLCYIQGNAGTAIFTVCFLAHLPSSSYRCFLTADKQSACGGFSQYGWAFRNRPEASLTAGKINLVPGRSERPDRSCLLVPQSSVLKYRAQQRGGGALITRLVLLLVTVRKYLLKEFLSSSFLSSSETLFQFKLISASLSKAPFFK